MRSTLLKKSTLATKTVSHLPHYKAIRQNLQKSSDDLFTPGLTEYLLDVKQDDSVLLGGLQNLLKRRTTSSGSNCRSNGVVYCAYSTDENGCTPLIRQR